MAKVKKIFVCNECGATSPKWMGRCQSCGAWNTIVEEVVVKETTREERSRLWKGNDSAGKEAEPIPLSEIQTGNTRRLPTPDAELNRVLGGGIVSGSLVLIGGQPGIGKSTLLLQLALQLPVRILYVSGEESEEQIKMRADRLGNNNPNCFLLTETNTAKILSHAQKIAPDLLIVDSIQTLSSPHIDSTPGSISQVRECAGELQRFAKQTNIPVILIGHITKDGAIAGPKLLEHIVDAVLQFEGDRNYTYRIL
ncbi:MAG: DNA repair protein RadA, partial [Bacteroidetes bacterium]